MAKIKIIFLIKDILTNKFFGTYRIDDYWTDMVNAKEFIKMLKNKTTSFKWLISFIKNYF